MIVFISTDVLDDEELFFIKSSFTDNIEIRVFANTGHKQLSDDLLNAVPILIQFALSAAMSGATWDIMKESVIYLFRNRPKKLTKELVVRITTEESITTISAGKKVIDSKTQHTVIEGATEELIREIVPSNKIEKSNG